MIKWIKLLSLVALGLIFQAESCTKTDENQTITQDAIAPPFEDKKMDIQPESFTLEASEGSEFSLPNGTHITVPKDCFSDVSGNVITGKVQLNYREFHTPADIIASGIMMTYDSANQTEQLQSAGMFEIQGVDEAGNAIFITEGKNIEVQMASFTSGDYNSYRLNEETKNWEYVSRTPTTDNWVKQAKLDQKVPASIRPIEPKEINPDDFAFELKTDLSKYPELREMEGVMFQFAGEDETQNPENKENQWVWENKWGDINLVCTDRENGLFQLLVKTDSRSFETVVTPVLRGKELEKARKMFAERMVAFEDAKAERKAESQRLANEADLLRKYNVTGFGTHNFDVIMPMTTRLNFAVEFDFGKEVDLDKNQISVFMIPEVGGSTAVRFMPQHWENFWILPNTPTKLVAVLPNQELAVLSREDYQKLDKQKIQNSRRAKIKLELLPDPLTSAQDLNEILAKL